ncbi:MAG: phage tail family protein [Eubacteriales bacterium]|nr:phage tail family protein [Eubacteriales bacterium]
MFDRLVYTNSRGDSVELSTGSRFRVNILNDVTGMSDVNATYYRDKVVGGDGTIVTGYVLDERAIVINGKIIDTGRGDREDLMRELQAVFSPFYAGVLRHEGSKIREINVYPEAAPKFTKREKARWTEFSLTLLAPNPNWRASAEKEKTIATGGTTIYYDGSRACGLEIEITAGADAIDMDSFTNTNGSTVQTITFRAGGGVTLMTGDVLLLAISQTGVTITLNAVNALERIDFTDTVFPLLYPGNNVLAWDAHGDEADFTVKVRYTPLYLGK